jgi:hypothetical protein
MQLLICTRDWSARSGSLEAARQEISVLTELRDKLHQVGDSYWMEQVDIQRQASTAWLLNAEGKHEEALKLASSAADIEDSTEKAPLTPGAVLPARELFAALLLEQGMAREPLAAYEATVKRHARCRGGRGKVGKFRQGATILCGGCCAHR